MEETSTRSALAVALAYFRSWTNKNFDETATLLHEDIRFEMPINSYESAEAFMDAVRFTGNNATNVNLLTSVGDDTEAILIYDFTFASIGNLRIAECFKIENGRIRLIRHIHDTFHLRNAGIGSHSE